MKKLVVPDWDCLEDFDAITARKKRRVALKVLRPKIEKSYAEYESRLNSSYRKSDYAEEEKSDLLHCYASETKGLTKLKTRLRALHDLVLCPYCDINTATTFDHHVPKDDFPEFSVFAPNLVRACHSCQTDERATQEWRDADGCRLLLHPYYDAIDDGEPLFSATIHFSSSPQCVEYEVPGERERPQGSHRFFTHWEALDLGPRYGRASRDLLRSTLNLIRSKARSPEQVQRVLQEYSGRERRDLGPNHWRSVFYAAAADDMPFIRYALAEAA